MPRLIPLLIVTGIMLLLDFYVFYAIRNLVEDYSPLTRKIIFGAYWAYTLICLAILVYFVSGGMAQASSVVRNFMVSVIFVNLLFKLLTSVFLVLEDMVRLLVLAWQSIFPSKPDLPSLVSEEKGLIPRSEFLTKTALIVAGTPVAVMTFGIISGAYDYRVKRVRVTLPNLPASFHGLRIGQLSDIHSGSFYNKKAVTGGVEMMMAEKPDLLFFTGDLVNNKADEAEDYVSTFAKLKAPLGVYSTLGNHDYGDYVTWNSLQAKERNLEDLKAAHQQMGWRLMMNEHHLLREGGDQLAIIGIENFGAKGNFPKYGRLDEAHRGTENAAVKLLLSHDPSHWDYQVRPQFPDIDIAFAGHTHGMQFGIETKYLKWSPVQYMYKQWAGLYQEGKQYLYVNRGFGFLGYPGRVGILPELTIMELVKA
jgi:uncharacterized protein